MQAGMKRVEANIMSRVKKGAMKEAAAKKALGLLTGTLTYDDFGSVDMVRCALGPNGVRLGSVSGREMR